MYFWQKVVKEIIERLSTASFLSIIKFSKESCTLLLAEEMTEEGKVSLFNFSKNCALSSRPVHHQQALITKSSILSRQRSSAPGHNHRSNTSTEGLNEFQEEKISYP